MSFSFSLCKNVFFFIIQYWVKKLCVFYVLQKLYFNLSSLFFLFLSMENNFFHARTKRTWVIYKFSRALSTWIFPTPISHSYPFPVPSDPVLPRNSKNYFFFTSLFAFSDFSLYQADVSFGSIHSSSLSSLSLSESVSSMATRRARIDATSWRFDCFWWRMSSRSCSTLRSFMPKSKNEFAVDFDGIWSVKCTNFYLRESHASSRLDCSRHLAREPLEAPLYVMRCLKGNIDISIQIELQISLKRLPFSISLSKPAWLFVCGVMIFAGLGSPLEIFPFGIGGGGAI